MVYIRKNLDVGDLITANNYTQQEVANAMGKSLTYVSNRCTLKEPWTTDDMIFISNLFGISDDEMIQYFVHPSEKMKLNRRKRK